MFVQTPQLTDLIFWGSAPDHDGGASRGPPTPVGQEPRNPGSAPFLEPTVFDSAMFLKKLFHWVYGIYKNQARIQFCCFIVYYVRHACALSRETTRQRKHEHYQRTCVFGVLSMCVCVCVCACVRVCLRACVRACVCCVHVSRGFVR